MREFLAKHELLWILPLTFLVALFSVFGLYSFEKNESQLEVLVPISQISEYFQPKNPGEIYCASELMIENFESFKTAQEKYRMVVFDPYYTSGAYVSQESKCSQASNGFLAEFSSKGYLLQGYLKEGN
jgi:hypothetical protein